MLNKFFVSRKEYEQLQRERDKFLNELSKTEFEYGQALSEIQRLRKKLSARIPKVGLWVGTQYDGYADGYPVIDVFECSRCEYEHNGEEDTLSGYCPNCGADMNYIVERK